MTDLTKLPAHVRRKLEAQHGSLSSSSKGTEKKEKKEKKATRKEKRDDARLHPRPYARALPTRRSPWTDEQWTREVACFASGIRCDIHRGLLRLRGLLEAPGAPVEMIRTEIERLEKISDIVKKEEGTP